MYDIQTLIRAERDRNIRRIRVNGFFRRITPKEANQQVADEKEEAQDTLDYLDGLENPEP